MDYDANTLQDAGLEIKWGSWGKTSEGRRVLYARNPKATHEHQREGWWRVSETMQGYMREDGIVNGFNRATEKNDPYCITA